MADDRTNRTDDDSREPRSENLGRRNFANDNYGATEREQTRDLRLTDPGPESIEDPEFGDADIANDENGE